MKDNLMIGWKIYFYKKPGTFSIWSVGENCDIVITYILILLDGNTISIRWTSFRYFEIIICNA